MMRRRIIAAAVTIGALSFGCLGFSQAQVTTSKADVVSKESDKILFDRAMKAMQQAESAAQPTLLENLINTYPDSDYVPRAKLSIADARYAQGTFKQAEVEYRDFITFFPNRPEVAGAQAKIEAIHKKARI
jgi:outer membrane protein assembly factor BamD